MPWLTPILDEWNDWVAQSLSRAWPNVNDNRRLAGFWFSTQGPGVAPMMGRLVTRFVYQGIEPTTLWAEVDCVSTGANQFGGNSGVNALGQRLAVIVTDHRAPHPVHGRPGSAWDWTYSRTGFTDDVDVNLFYPWDLSLSDPRIPYDFDYARIFTLPTGVIYTTSFEPGQDTDWTVVDPIQTCTWKAITSGRKIAKN